MIYYRPQKVLSLEEAEQKMNAAGNSVQLNTNSRLGALAAKGAQDLGFLNMIHFKCTIHTVQSTASTTNGYRLQKGLALALG